MEDLRDKLNNLFNYNILYSHCRVAHGFEPLPRLVPSVVCSDIVATVMLFATVRIACSAASVVSETSGCCCRSICRQRAVSASYR